MHQHIGRPVAEAVPLPDPVAQIVVEFVAGADRRRVLVDADDQRATLAHLGPWGGRELTSEATERSAACGAG